MSIYKPSELMEFLNSLGVSPKKALSQNFLIDGNIIRKIVSTSKVEAGDVILEIGPGPGSLTQELLNANANVIAVEIDNKLAEGLKRLQTSQGSLHIFQEDVLKFPIEPTLRKHLAAGQKAKVIANLPYKITTPILCTLIPMTECFSTITIMVQEEFALRLAAKPGNKHYSSFTVFLNFYADVEYAFKVSKNCFYPKPRIESAIIILHLKPPPLVKNQAAFFEMTRTSFEHRRKMLRASLKDLYPQDAIIASLTSLGLNPLARPEDLSLQNFLNLFDALCPLRKG